MAGWTDERVEKLKKLWAEGLSASQCARMLGGFASYPDEGRSAVIGKTYRMGLTRHTGGKSGRKRGSASTQGHGWRKQAAERKAARQRAKPAPRNPALAAVFALPVDPVAAVEEIFIPVDERKQLLDLGDRGCRWPIGDPKVAGFHFCGRAKATGLVYCHDHARRAFQPPIAPRRKPAQRDYRVVGGVGSPGNENVATRVPGEFEEVS